MDEWMTYLPRHPNGVPPFMLRVSEYCFGGSSPHANLRGEGKWYRCKIVQDRGDGSYQIKYDDGLITDEWDSKNNRRQLPFFVLMSCFVCMFLARDPHSPSYSTQCFSGPQLPNLHCPLKLLSHVGKTTRLRKHLTRRMVTSVLKRWLPILVFMSLAFFSTNRGNIMWDKG